VAKKSFRGRGAHGERQTRDAEGVEFETSVAPAPIRQTRQMLYHSCSWYDTQGILPYRILALVIAFFVLYCLVIRLQWQQNVISRLTFQTEFFCIKCNVAFKVFKKGKVFPYSLPSVGPGADPGVQVCRACGYLRSFHQMALPVNGSTHLIPAFYSFYRPRKDERLA